MKKLSKEELKLRLDESTKKTGYVYTFTGQEKQKDKIKVFCPTHNFQQDQIREYCFQSRKINCCNEFSPMLESECNDVLKNYNTNSHIKVELEENFKGVTTKVKVYCSKHNYSRIITLESLRCKKTNIACNKCTHELMNRNHTFTGKQWAEKANKVHDNFYDYSKTEDSGLYRTITCPKHGDFQQNIHNHVYLGNGCPKCFVMPSISNGEHEINTFLNELGFKEGIDYSRNDRSVLDHYELDFYFKDKKLAIEFNGDYWHSSEKKSRKYHQEKKLIGMQKNINVIMIYEHLWKNKIEIVKNRLKSLLSCDTNIVYARKTDIKEVSSLEAKDFCEKYHIQGWTVSSINYGLFLGAKLVSLMTFGKSRFTKDTYELLRYVSDGTVVGGASKLFNHFKEDHKFSSIISYADLDWSVGNLYEVLKFENCGVTNPSYVWVKGNIIKSRYQTQIKDEDKIMKNEGFLKIYKCGSLKYIFKNTQTSLL